MEAERGNAATARIREELEIVERITPYMESAEERRPPGLFFCNSVRTEYVCEARDRRNWAAPRG